MLPASPVSGKLSFQEKLLLAQGVSLGAAEPPLDALVTLASDPQEEIRNAARETLRRIPDEQCSRWLAAQSLPEGVARHFLDPAYLRPALLPILLSRPDAPQDAINRIAGGAGPEIVIVLLDQIDLLKTPALIALKENPTYLLWQKEPPAEGYVIEADLLDLLIREMQAEDHSSAEALEATLEDQPQEAGIVRKISRMNVAQRVKLALLGTKEERAMLIRDPSKVVFRSVLSSPKLTEAEIEGFAALKSVSQDVLRLISTNRKFMKNYTVLRNLVNNPRATIDVTLPLLNRLLPNDLRAVSASRDVPDTVRKMAQKLVKDRTAH
jgi:hypothetical protein